MQQIKFQHINNLISNTVVNVKIHVQNVTSFKNVSLLKFAQESDLSIHNVSFNFEYVDSVQQPTNLQPLQDNFKQELAPSSSSCTVNVLKFVQKHGSLATALKGDFNNSYICVNATPPQQSALFESASVFENMKIVGAVQSAQKFSLLAFKADSVIINRVFIDFDAECFVFSLLEQVQNLMVDQLYLKLKVKARQAAGLALQTKVLKVRLMLTEQQVQAEIAHGLCYKAQMVQVQQLTGRFSQPSRLVGLAESVVVKKSFVQLENGGSLVQQAGSVFRRSHVSVKQCVVVGKQGGYLVEVIKRGSTLELEENKLEGVEKVWKNDGWIME